MDIALGSVLDLVPQHIYRLYRHIPFGLFNRRQVDSWQRGGRDIVKPDQAQPARNVNPRFVRGLQKTQGVGVLDAKTAV